MWGCISTEATYQYNFSTTFSSSKSDVLVHLAQWQYWWWFWFAFLWSFYYLLTVKVIRYRTLKMKPKIVTSLKPRGKWGDFIAAIIPGLWCLNILTNSNFILRLIEWQNESSIFLVRIRARQWYWVYKFEIKNIIDIISTPKNIGRNKWFFSNFGDTQYSENYFNILRLKAKIIKTEEFWGVLFKEIDKNNYEMNTIFIENFFTFHNSQIKSPLSLKNMNFLKYYYEVSLLNNKKSWKPSLNLLEKSNIFFISDSIKKHIIILNNNISDISNNFFSHKFKEKIYQPSVKINYSNTELQSRFLKRNFGVNLPCRILKLPLNILLDEKVAEENNPHKLFSLDFNNGGSLLSTKCANDIFFYTIKQLKYKRRTSLPILNKFKFSEENNKKELLFKGRTVLLNNVLFFEYLKNFENLYKVSSKNKIHTEQMPVSLTKRLLRTRRTLVLPAHMNITLITNSFDVVHSWFVPGLGLKLDCVPGRSTHHTLYIDNVGFYYGQCAEICGRYHHHMPIRICALPFEHFLIWWNVFGLPKIMFSNKKNSYISTFACRKFLW